MKRLELASFAKINLELRVLGRRDDGYHEIRTTLQTIDLADEILLEEDSSLSLVVEGSRPVAAGESNLVMMAARALAERYPGLGARITLRKSLPVGAGLGGGSSNAAATLMGLDRLCGLEADPGIQYAIARKLGMDVPFFLYGGTCLAVGRGEEILPLPDAAERRVVVVWPGKPLSTPQVYGGLPLPLTQPRILSSMKGFVPVEHRPLEVVNDLEKAAFAMLPALQRLKERLIDLGAEAAAMSGSGSSIFGLFSSAQAADKAAAALTAGETVAYSCRTLSRDAYRLSLFKRSWT